MCRYWKRCEDRRRDDDHLSLVAGISRRQRDRLGLAGVARLEELGVLDRERRIDGIPTESLAACARASGAAAARVASEGRAIYELLHNDAPGIGLEALPKPTPGDLFLDLEGDSFVLDDGLEYLFGLVDFGEPELDFTVRDAPGPAALSGVLGHESRRREARLRAGHRPRAARAPRVSGPAPVPLWAPRGRRAEEAVVPPRHARSRGRSAAARRRAGRSVADRAAWL